VVGRDGAHAVSEDMKSHAGEMMNVGKGAACAMSTQHKLNTKSLTDAEREGGVSDMISQVTWIHYFLESHGGCGVNDSIVHQDNQSTMLLEKSGKGSSSKRTRHPSIRHLFVTNRIAAKEMNVKCLPTGEMNAESCGSLFRKLRGRILNMDVQD
jgi:hypothetical protein